MRQNHYYRFDSFMLDPRSRILLRDGRRIHLTPKMFDLLQYLVEHPGRVIAHDEFFDRIWSNVFVSNSVLVQNISALRRALRNERPGIQFIETVPKRGYSFSVPVTRGDPLPTFEARKTLAVLPLSADGAVVSGPNPTEQEFLGISIADALTLRLGRYPDITVRPMSSILVNRLRELAALDVGRTLAVSHVVTGSLAVTGKVISASLELLRVATRQSVWRGTFEFTTHGLLGVERNIASRIHDAMVESLPASPEPPPPPNPDALAYEHYLKGRYFWNRRSTADILKAIACFEESVRLDPEFGLAWSGLCDCHSMMIHYGTVAPLTAIPKARHAAAMAVKFSPQASEAQASRGYVLAAYDWDWLASEDAFRTAIEFNPNNINVRHWLASLYVVLRRPEESIRATDEAREVDPLSPILLSSLAWNLYLMDEYERAEAVLEEVLQLEASFAPALLYLARVYLVQQRYREAVSRFAAAHDFFGSPSTEAEYAQARILAGDVTAGRETLHRLLRRRHQEYVSPYALAFVFDALDERRKVEEMLDQCCAEHSISMMWFGIEPRFAKLRKTPFGQKLLRRSHHLPVRPTPCVESQR